MSAPTDGAAPAVSIVVALVSGAPEHLRTCLGALTRQRLESVEILVPYDDPCADVLDLASEFPAVRFIHAAGLDSAAARAGASREHHDDLRTLGLKLARGEIIFLIEDVGRVGEGWCQHMIAALERHSEAAAVGGAMDCGSERMLNRAVCMADFWRYQPPLTDQAATYASDANIAYRRPRLHEVGDVWDDCFHETVVNGALQAKGHALRWVPDAVIYQERGVLGWGEALRERYVWGRSFAGTRAADAPVVKRFIWAALSPALPLLLGARIARGAIARGTFWSRCLPVLPLVLVLLVFWSLGETVGYVTARPDGG